MMANRSAYRLALQLIVVLAIGLGGILIGRWSTGGDSSSGESGDREIAYWRAPMDPAEIYDAPGKSRMGMDLVPVYADELDGAESGTDPEDREIAYWRAPMDPTEIYDAPGKSRMGMDLVPVYSDDVGGAGGLISIDPEIAQNMGVRSARVERRDFSRMIRTVGEVDYDEERLYLVNSKVSGWIERLYVNFVGEEVQAGQPLMEIYSPELVSTQEEFLLAVRNVRSVSPAAPAFVREDAETLLEAARKRLEYWDIPDEEITRLESSGELRKTVTINAPATGVVIERNAIDGAFVQAGRDLFRIADLRTVWVHASFYDNEVPWISEGQSVEMELSYLPGRTYHGSVAYIYPFLREKARDVHVRLVFRNTNAIDLKPGMYANVVLQGKTIADALVIPSEAVIRSGERTLAFVVRGGGKFEPREIRIGEVGGVGNREIRVLSGLLADEEIVVSAQFLLDSESRLQEVIQKMLASGIRGSGSDGPEIPRTSEASDSTRPMPEMDHDAMDHDAMDHDAMDHDAMDHDAMDHDAMDHDAMDHGAMTVQVDSAVHDHGNMIPDLSDTLGLRLARPDTTHAGH